MQRDMKRHFQAIAGFILLLLAGLACTLPTFTPVDTPTPLPPPTPVGDVLFLRDSYSFDLQPGETVPGTRLEYIGPNGDAYDVRIDGQKAIKKIGDSFFWKGIIAPGVYANYELRLAAPVFGGLQATGPVDIAVLNPEPVELLETTQFTPTLRFENISVNYVVPKGGTLPGTTLVYEGLAEEQDQNGLVARFSGTNQYPFLVVGDSLTWQGRLRENVIVRYTLRAVAIDKDRVNMTGTAELLILG